MTGLITALKIIREECKSHSSCKQCPLRDYSGGGCSIRDGVTPENWKLKGDEPDNRLFV